MNLTEVKALVNNTKQTIRPLQKDGEPLLYSFSVVNNILIDSKGRVENEEWWVDSQFVINTKEIEKECEQLVNLLGELNENKSNKSLPSILPSEPKTIKAEWVAIS